MSRVEKMIDSVNRSPVKYMEFTRIFAKKPKAAICFFEGEDVKYYGIRIQNLSNKCEWFPLECKGKKDVIDLYKTISEHTEYRVANALFFIDKDFDEPTGDKHILIYETPCYSVENFYVTESCLSRVLNSEFKLTEFCEHAECYSNSMKKFVELREQFHNAVIYLNAWIKATRIIEKKSTNSTKLNLNNVKLNKIVTISLDGVSKKYKNDELSTIYKTEPELSKDQIQDALNSFNNERLECVLRGKYEAEFVRIFINKLSKDRNSIKPTIFKEKGNVKLHVSGKNFLSDLSQYADTPSCLVDFLKHHFNNIAEKQTIH